MTQPARIGIVGGGWRTEAYLRVAQARPDLFSIGAFLVRSDAGAARLTDRWGVRAGTSEDSFVREGFDYILVCVPRDTAPDFTRRFARADIPVLCETPLATDLAATVALYRELGDEAPVEVAEQYRFQPHHAARLGVAASGILGDVDYVRASVAHDYHAMSLIRQALGVGFADAEVEARALTDRSAVPLDRDGWSADPPTVDSQRISARIRFDGGPVADYDFSDEQYFSPIRSRHLTIRGDRGEITDDDVRYLTSANEPVAFPHPRQETGLDGDLEGRFLRGITLGAESVYRNPFAPARLSDDEIAIAAVLLRMNEFARTRASFYGFAEAAQDHYLALAVHESASTGRAVRTVAQPWAARR